MRHIYDRLHQFLVRSASNFVQHQRQQNRRRKPHDDLIQADHNRIFQHQWKKRGFKNLLEIEQAHPFASQKAPCHSEVLKGHDDSIHRDILEDDKKQCSGKQHTVKRNISFQPQSQFAAFRNIHRRPRLASKSYDCLTIIELYHRIFFHVNTLIP